MDHYNIEQAEGYSYLGAQVSGHRTGAIYCEIYYIQRNSENLNYKMYVSYMRNLSLQIKFMLAKLLFDQQNHED